jgi:hypothetical protein
VPWTVQDEDLLLHFHHVYDPRWKLIARFFPERNDCQLKNQWYSDPEMCFGDEK